MCNPRFTQGPLHQIILPIRKKRVAIQPAHTHHSHLGGSRALDLIFASASLAVDMRIHNSLHCRELGCSWDICHEFTAGDHFLTDFQLPHISLLPHSSGSIAPPSGWDDQVRWFQGLEEANGVFQSFNDVLEPLCGCIEGIDARQKPSRPLAQWLANASACILATIEGLVRDGWVLAAQIPNSKRRRLSIKPMQHTAQDADPIETWLADTLNDCAPQPVVNTCLRWLKPVLPFPPLQLVDRSSGEALSAADSHQQWLLAIREQFEIPAGWDDVFHQQVERKAAGILGMERRAIGADAADAPVSQVDWVRGTSFWNPSRAVTPDLLPRCVFELAGVMWTSSAWLCMRLCGPGCLAIRPEVWRWKRLTALYKKGSSDSAHSYRFISVMQQHGLLQEHILFSRVQERMQGAISCFQSGFMRDVADPHLCLYELGCLFLSRKQPLLLFMADLVKAFPRTWRAYLVNAIHEAAGIRWGAMSLFHSILSSDEWLIPLSGLSWEKISDGVPEGCRIGPPCFNFLPDTLVSMLLEERCGVAFRTEMPAPWKSCSWKGCGTPDPAVTQHLLHALRTGQSLPSAERLEADAVLEASAARAIDLNDPWRIPVLLHADDPLFFASSVGEMRRVLRVVAAWSRRYKTTLHCTVSKSVILPIGEQQQTAAISHQASFLYGSFHMRAALPLSVVNSHKWLGILWDEEMKMYKHACAVIASQDSKVSVLGGLVASGTLPLPFALYLFDLKIGSCLRFGRWLWGISMAARSALDTAFATWAKILIGADSWRNSGVAFAELGWNLSGSALCVLDVACARARLWQTDLKSLAGIFFRCCCERSNSWASCSKRLLDAWDLSDWPAWSREQLAQHRTLTEYKKYCKLHLAISSQTKWLADVASHRSPVQYFSFPASPCCLVGLGVPWDLLKCSLALAKFRAGLLSLGHLQGARSRANTLHCIGCERRFSSGVLWFHVLLSCERFREVRDELENTLGRKLLPNDVWLEPSVPAFTLLLKLIGAIYARHGLFWKHC